MSVPTEQTEAVPELSVEEIDARLAEHRARVAALIEEESLTRLKAEALQEQIADQEAELQTVQAWISSIDRSYFWKLQQRMRLNLERARADLDEFEHAVSSLAIPGRDTLHRLRETFHKRLARGILALAIPVIVLFLILWLARATLPEDLIEYAQSEWYILSALAAIAVIVSVIWILARVTKVQWLPNRVIVGVAITLVVLAAVLYIVGALQREGVEGELAIDDFEAALERWRTTIIIVYAAALATLLMSLLIAYYAGWSVFRRQVSEQFVRLDNVAHGYVQTKQEFRRLEQIYEQLSDWLEIIAHNLYRPWRIDPRWATSHELQMTAENFPFSLRVAQAMDADPAQNENLERPIADRLLAQGWRQEAFADALSEIGKSFGHAGRITPEVLDADLPHRTNSSRSFVLARLRAAAAADRAGALDVDLGDELPADEAFLVEVARTRLRELIRTTQSSVLSEARPDVMQVVDDPLAVIREGHLGVAREIERTTWDDFLRETLGIAEEDRAMLSAMSFTDEGLAARAPSTVKTRVIVPQRIAASLPSPPNSAVEIVPTVDASTGRSAEVLVRFDVVGPIPFEHVHLVQGANPGVPVTRPADEIEVDDQDEL